MISILYMKYKPKKNNDINGSKKLYLVVYVAIMGKLNAVFLW